MKRNTSGPSSGRGFCLTFLTPELRATMKDRGSMPSCNSLIVILLLSPFLSRTTKLIKTRIQAIRPLGARCPHTPKPNEVFWVHAIDGARSTSSVFCACRRTSLHCCAVTQIDNVCCEKGAVGGWLNVLAATKKAI